MKISERILQIAKNQKVTKKKIYDLIGITQQGFDNKLREDYFLISELQQISTLLNTPVSTFIGEDASKVVNGNNIVGNSNTHISIETYKVENEHLKKELQLKDEIIELLKSK